MKKPRKSVAELLGELGEVLKLSLPIIITMGSHTVMQTVDTLMLGAYGREELAAVSPAGLAFFTFASFLIGIVSCNNTFVSQSLGADRRDECATYTIHAVYLALAAQLFMIPLMLMANRGFALLGHAPDVQLLETTYFRVRSFQMAGIGCTVALSAFFQGTDRAKIPMYTGIAANALNIVGDYALIFGHFGLPRLGIFGAAAATTGATYLEAILLLIIFLSPGNNATYVTHRWKNIRLDYFLRLLKIGLWTGVSFFLEMASWTLFSAWLIGRLGTNMLAGYSAASQIMHLSIMPTIGMNIGVTALVGRYIGKGDIPGAKRRAYLSMACGAVYMSIMGVVFIVFRHQLIGMFRDTPEVIAAGSTILAYMALYQFVDAFGILSQGALKGAGDTRYPALVGLAAAWFFFIPAAAYFGRPETLGVHGAYICAVVYIWAVDILLFARFMGEKWRKIDIFASRATPSNELDINAP